MILMKAELLTEEGQDIRMTFIRYEKNYRVRLLYPIKNILKLTVKLLTLAQVIQPSCEAKQAVI